MMVWEYKEFWYGGRKANSKYLFASYQELMEFFKWRQKEKLGDCHQVDPSRNIAWYTFELCRVKIEERAVMHDSIEAKNLQKNLEG